MDLKIGALYLRRTKNNKYINNFTLYFPRAYWDTFNFSKNIKMITWYFYILLCLKTEKIEKYFWTKTSKSQKIFFFDTTNNDNFNIRTS